MSGDAAVTKTRRVTRWNLLGCPKLADRSQPLMSRSLPYCGDMWTRYCCSTYFSDCRYMPQLRRYSPTKLSDSAQMAIFCVIFCVLYFPRAAWSTFQTCIVNSHFEVATPTRRGFSGRGYHALTWRSHGHSLAAYLWHHLRKTVLLPGKCTVWRALSH